MIRFENAVKALVLVLCVCAGDLTADPASALRTKGTVFDGEIAVFDGATGKFVRGAGGTNASVYVSDLVTLSVSATNMAVTISNVLAAVDTSLTAQIASNDTDVLSLLASNVQRVADIAASDAAIAGLLASNLVRIADHATQSLEIGTNATDVAALLASNLAAVVRLDAFDTALAGNDADIAGLLASNLARVASIDSLQLQIGTNVTAIAALVDGTNVLRQADDALGVLIAANTAVGSALTATQGVHAVAIAAMQLLDEGFGSDIAALVTGTNVARIARDALQVGIDANGTVLGAVTGTQGLQAVSIASALAQIGSNDNDIVALDLEIGSNDLEIVGLFASNLLRKTETDANAVGVTALISGTNVLRLADDALGVLIAADAAEGAALTATQAAHAVSIASALAQIVSNDADIVVLAGTTNSAAQGAKAYGWGDHSSAGYATSDSNVYEEVRVRVLSDVDSELVSNGDFAITNDWDLGGNAEISGGILNVPAGMTSGVATQSIATVRGKGYRVVVTKGTAAGAVTIGLGDDVWTLASGFTGTATNALFALSTNVVLGVGVAAGASLNGYVDDISVKEIVDGDLLVADDAFVGGDVFVAGELTVGETNVIAELSGKAVGTIPASYITGVYPAYTSLANTVWMQAGEGFCSNEYFSLSAEQSYTVTNIPASDTKIIYIAIDYSASTFPDTLVFYNTTNHPAVGACGVDQIGYGADRVVGAVNSSGAGNTCAYTTIGTGRTFIFDGGASPATGTHIKPLNENTNPIGNWQDPTTQATDYAPVGTVRMKFRIDHQDAGAVGQYAMVPKAYADASTSTDWRSGTYHCYIDSGYGMRYHNFWISADANREFEILGANDDDNLMRTYLQGWEMRR